MDQRIDYHKLQRLADEREITGKQIAGWLGVTPQAVGRWLRGDCQPRITRLVSLAQLFSLTVDELFVDAGEK